MGENFLIGILIHDDSIISWKRSPHYLPFVKEIHQWLVVFSHKRPVMQSLDVSFANASENLAERVENRPGQVEFCIDYIRDCPVRASAKNF